MSVGRPGDLVVRAWSAAADGTTRVQNGTVIGAAQARRLRQRWQNLKEGANGR